MLGHEAISEMEQQQERHASSSSSPPPPSSTPQLRPRFSVSYIFQKLRENDQAASWLFSKDPEPPGIVTPEMMQNSVTIDSIVLTDPKHQVSMFKRMEERKHDESKQYINCDVKTGDANRIEDSKSGSGSGSRDDSKRSGGAATGSNYLADATSSSHNFLPFAAAPQEPDVEKIVWVLHAVMEKYVLISMADTRTPFAFLEPVGTLVPGVRRCFGHSLENGYMSAMMYWLVDGRSTLLVFFYISKPSFYGEKHFMLLRPFPSSRYPNEQDVIESNVCIEQRDCQFCLARGFLSCECVGNMRERLRPLASACIDGIDVWNWWRWIWNVQEQGLKKYQILLSNNARNVVVPSTLYTQLRPTSNLGPMMHRNAFQNYLDSIAQYVNRKLGDFGLLSPNFGMVRSSPRKRKLFLLESVPKEESRQIMLAGPSQKEARSSEEIIHEGIHSLSHIEYTNSGSGNDILDPEIKKSTSRLPVLSFPENRSDPLRFALGQHTAANRSRSTATDPANETDAAKMDAGAASSVPGEDSVKQRVLELIEQLENTVWTPGMEADCSLCGLHFIRKHDMKRHLKAVHLSERAFSCPECGSRFSRRAHLENHYQSVHLHATSYGCFYCDRVYTAESTRRKHIKKFHPGKDVTAPASS